MIKQFGYFDVVIFTQFILITFLFFFDISDTNDLITIFDEETNCDCIVQLRFIVHKITLSKTIKEFDPYIKIDDSIMILSYTTQTNVTHQAACESKSIPIKMALTEFY